MKISTASRVLVLSGLLLGCSMAQPSSVEKGHPSPHGDRREAASGGQEVEPGLRAVDLTALPLLAQIMPKLESKRVVFVGETHDRFEHHLVQLEIVRRLHAVHPKMALGLEFFQQPYQQYLDDYVAGRITETEMLERTEYFQRWRFDYRLYRPILQYARENAIPVIALNVPEEITHKIARGGLESLTPEERKQVPQEIDRSDEAYRERLKAIHGMHPGSEAGDFEHFVEAQLVWDEGMAARAAEYLERHPDRKMVVLAGSGHVAYGSGIPNRLKRRMPVNDAIVLSDSVDELSPDLADYLLLPARRELPPPGRLGIFLDEQAEGIRVGGFDEGSPAREAGIEQGDRIVGIAGRTIDSLADVRIAMLDKKPNEEVSVLIRRDGWFSDGSELTYTVDLR